MKFRNILSKFKIKLTKAFAAVSAATASLMITSMIETNAAPVDFSNGVTQVANSVTSQAKTIAGVVFAAVAIFALAFTVAKGVKAAFAYRRNEEVHIAPVVAGGIGTVLCGLASSAAFFGWFGL